MDDRYKKHPVAALAAVMVGLTSGNAMAGGLLGVNFADANFSNFVSDGNIDNPYWPLNPDDPYVGPRTWTYIGETDDECVINQVVYEGNMYAMTTTDTDSPYFGFTALEIRDTEWVFEEVDECGLDLLSDGDADEAITEETLDWYAQDNQQNIWYLGELSQVFEDDCGPYPGPADPDPECFEGSWEAGIDGDPGPDVMIGEAGIVVPGDEPVAGESLRPGTFYMQEVAYEAEDMAKILRLGASVDDAYEDSYFGPDYEGCRKVKEWTALEPGASVEHKWYCPGPGLVRIQGIGGGPTEVEELVSIDPLITP